MPGHKYLMNDVNFHEGKVSNIYQVSTKCWLIQWHLIRALRHERGQVQVAYLTFDLIVSCLTKEYCALVSLSKGVLNPVSLFIYYKFYLLKLFLAQAGDFIHRS